MQSKLSILVFALILAVLLPLVIATGCSSGRVNKEADNEADADSLIKELEKNDPDSANMEKETTESGDSLEGAGDKPDYADFDSLEGFEIETNEEQESETPAEDEEDEIADTAPNDEEAEPIEKEDTYESEEYPTENESAETKSWIILNAPPIAKVGEPAEFSITASSDVVRIIADVDGWMIADAQPENGALSFSYSFTNSGENRLARARGYDQAGNLAASAESTIAVEPSITPSVKINFPPQVKTGSPVHFSGGVSGAITTVTTKVDGYVIANTQILNGTFEFDYSFSNAGMNRALLALGMSAEGELLAQASGEIDVLANVDYIEGVPYFYQYYNSINPGGSCQNTSMAMVLKFYGADVTPDDISGYYGTSKAQTVSGFEEVFNSEASYFGLSARDDGTTTGTFSELRSLLSQGAPVIVHGYFTAYGHVIVLLGYDGTKYWANDPAGEWSQIYQVGGYAGSGPQDGEYVTYGKAALEEAVGPDGEIWMHRIIFR